MKRLSLTTLCIWFGIMAAAAQIVTSDPGLPTINDAVTVYFDATKGTGGLKGYTGDVYAHTGVLTMESRTTSDWKYVKTDWGQNTPDTKLTRISEDYYSLEINPDIRTYYGVAAGDTVTHLAFVFRSGEPITGSSSYYEGKDDGGLDIFLEVFEEGLKLSIMNPASSSLVVDPGDTIPLLASASLADSISLYINQQYVKTSDSKDSLEHTIIAGAYGDNRVRVVAYGESEHVADSFFFYVRKPIVEEALRVGLKDGINYTSDTSVALVLYAPLKESVFVIGEFTRWSPSEDGAMKITPDGQRFWKEFGSLEPGREYTFQYLVDGDIRIADPYADKFLDPWNDKYIPEETYPGLIPYPAGKTVQMVSVLQTAQVPYEWKHTDFTPPDRNRLVIYELLLRDFLEAHDFKTLTDTLDYLNSLGVSAIELMPFNEFDGNISWGYNPAFYFAPDKYYGPKNTLKAFIDSCHARGIAVIQDMVLNHSFGQNSFVRLYMDNQTGRPTAENPWFNENSPNPVYNWGYDFNHESQATRDFVDRVNRYWMTEYRVDGFRFDFTKGFTNTPGEGWDYDSSRISILKRMADTIWSTNPDAYVILEHFTDNEEEKELSDYGMLVWGNMNHEFAEAIMGYASDFSWASSLERGWTDPHMVAYMESHDEERIQYKAKTWGVSISGYNVKDFITRMERGGLTAVFYLAIPGPKMIWQFGEIGYSISIGDESVRTDPKPILWDLYMDRRRQRLYQINRTMMKLRDEYPVFRTGDYDYELSSYQKRLNLNHPEMNVTLIGNFGTTKAKIDPQFQSPGTWYEYFSGLIQEVADVHDSILLRPGEYHLYTDQQLEPPDIITPVFNLPGREDHVSLNAYPNPASEVLYLEIAAGRSMKMDVRIHDIRGRLIRKWTKVPIQPGGNMLLWDGRTDEGIRVPPGIYIVQATGEDASHTARIVVQ